MTRQRFSFSHTRSSSTAVAAAAVVNDDKIGVMLLSVYNTLPFQHLCRECQTFGRVVSTTILNVRRGPGK